MRKLDLREISCFSVAKGSHGHLLVLQEEDAEVHNGIDKGLELRQNNHVILHWLQGHLVEDPAAQGF